jgi:hypothetical protein
VLSDRYRFAPRLFGKYIRKIDLSIRRHRCSPAADFIKGEGQRVGKLLWVEKQRGFQIRILHVARPGGEEQFTNGGDNLAGSAA